MDSCNYWDMINLKSTSYSEPPNLRNLSVVELNLMVLELNVKSDVFQSIFKFPCHTQAVGRRVKLITETAKNICGEDKRVEVLRTTFLFLKLMGKCDSRKDLKIK